MNIEHHGKYVCIVSGQGSMVFIISISVRRLCGTMMYNNDTTIGTDHISTIQVVLLYCYIVYIYKH